MVGTNFNFEKMGIGGLDDEFKTIFRKAFASRAAAPSVRVFCATKACVAPCVCNRACSTACCGHGYEARSWYAVVRPTRLR